MVRESLQYLSMLTASLSRQSFSRLGHPCCLDFIYVCAGAACDAYTVDRNMMSGIEGMLVTSGAEECL